MPPAGSSSRPSCSCNVRATAAPKATRPVPPADLLPCDSAPTSLSLSAASQTLHDGSPPACTRAGARVPLCAVGTKVIRRALPPGWGRRDRGPLCEGGSAPLTPGTETTGCARCRLCSDGPGAPDGMRLSLWDHAGPCAREVAERPGHKQPSGGRGSPRVRCAAEEHQARASVAKKQRNCPCGLSTQWALPLGTGSSSPLQALVVWRGPESSVFPPCPHRHHICPLPVPEKVTCFHQKPTCCSRPGDDVRCRGAGLGSPCGSPQGPSLTAT